MAPAAAPPELIVHPASGEVLPLDATTDLLAEAALEIKQRERQLREMRQLVETELLGRLERQGRRRATVGDYEIAVESSGRSRVWDPDDLEATCRELVDNGVLQTSELGGLITTVPKVDGKLAAALLTRVTRPARDALERCFSWEQRGRARLSVTKSIPLLPPEEES